MASNRNITIVDKLRERQTQLVLSDTEMADMLGCSRQLWQMTRTGKTPLGKKVIAGVIAAFPELKGDIIYFLSNDVKITPKQDVKNFLIAPFFKAQRGLKGFARKLLRRVGKGA